MIIDKCVKVSSVLGYCLFENLFVTETVREYIHRNTVHTVSRHIK